MKTLNKNAILMTICAMLMVCCFVFVGCGETSTSEDDKHITDGFAAVCSIEYKYDRYNSSPYTATLHSIYQYQYDLTEITKEEFDNSNLEIGTLNYEDNMSVNKTPVYFNQNSGIEYKFSTNTSSDPNATQYYIGTLTAYTEAYIYVKPHSDGSLEIIDINNNHYRITTSFYKIEYFS